jgi:hypothetical protein
MAKAVEGHRTPRRGARHDASLKYPQRLGVRQSIRLRGEMAAGFARGQSVRQNFA